MKVLAQTINKDSGKILIQAFISFIELRCRVKFTYRKDPGYNIYAPETEEDEQKRQDYQRKIDERHLKDIKTYIASSMRNENNTMPLFPTPLLLAYNEEEGDESMQEIKREGIADWQLPSSFFVIDGQHRLQAMIDVYESQSNTDIRSKIENYEFSCFIYVNFDIWEQSKIFADVNFKQKKVNKSLYYDIYGTIEPGDDSTPRQNALFIIHQLVEHLNQNPDSPLKGNIKMLGNGKGTISQAFIVESLINNIMSPRGIWYPGFDGNISDNRLSAMKRETLGYLKVVANILSDQWNSPESILKKTTGIGAMFKLMGYIHQDIKRSLGVSKKEALNQSSYEKDFRQYIELLEPHQQELFSSDGEYGKTGGSGLQSKLYRRLVEIIDEGNR